MKLKPLSIYIHIPFCEKRCDYCDFVSFDDCSSQMDAYVDALCGEIKGYSEKCKKHVIETLFFGGGTPSTLSAEQMTKIFESLRENFVFCKDVEASIECNPNSLTKEKLDCYIQLGINRISLGIQSINDITLSTLGRVHTKEQVEQALELLDTSGIDNVSIDFMYNIPMPRDIADAGMARNIYGELDYIFSKFPFIKHVSAYALTVYEGTEIAKKLDFEMLYDLNEDVAIAEEFELSDVLKKYGFTRYEVSNWTRPGFECRHNKVYWTVKREYLGLGVSASGLFNNERYENTHDLNMYLLNPEKISTSVKRSNLDIINEAIILGLRTKYGIDTGHLKKLGVNLQIQKSFEILELANMGLLRVTKNSIKATKDGMLLLNLVTARLMMDDIGS
ncbi:MAG: radical SAM family heme chaperone HemW [Firmicutes bacterium]|nr:radical SAM family heme chaperone HemW [Bacillota bacterium]